MMKTILFFILFFLMSGNGVYGQQDKDSCDPWKLVVTRKGLPDTLRIKAKLIGTESNMLNLYDDEKNPDFFHRLSKKFDMPLTLLVELLDCHKFLSYPFIYKSKYDYTLFPRKNKQGKFVNWKRGQMIEITCVRFNQYYRQSNKLVTIISDIKPIGEIID